MKMKKLKKLAAVFAAVIMVLSVSGCGSDPVADEFQNFINNDMTEINANYEVMKEEVAKWEGFETPDEFVDSLNNTVIPNINSSIELLGAINLETEEVIAIKEKYQAVLLAYKDGYGEMLQGFRSGDEDKVESGSEKVENAVSLLDDYNAALEALAEEKGLSVEY